MDSDLSKYIIARIIAEYKGVYRVKTTKGEFLAKITGRQMFLAEKREDYPAVGDFVLIDELPEGKAVIHKVLPRKTVLSKKYSDKQDTQIIATNIDTAFVVESCDRDYNLNRIERYLVLARDAGIAPIIVLNKIDLISEKELTDKTAQIKQRFGDVEIILTSVVAELGLKNLEEAIISGKTYCFLGSSGVGKSSLINKLLDREEIKTKEISKVTGRGKHTTTTREMYFLENGGIVVDNPGTREVGLTIAESGIAEVFDDIISLSLNCKFSDCKHLNEPGCAVKQALTNGALDQDKYDNYFKLKKESEFYGMSDVEKRTKDKKFGKFVKSALKSLKR
jgi:ribosome biogenesis GTPase